MNEEENNMHPCVLAVTYSSPRAPHLQGELAKDEKIGSDGNSWKWKQGIQSTALVWKGKGMNAVFPSL